VPMNSATSFLSMVASLFSNELALGRTSEQGARIAPGVRRSIRPGAELSTC